jgi:hypothetical protein
VTSAVNAYRERITSEYADYMPDDRDRDPPMTPPLLHGELES